MASAAQRANLSLLAAFLRDKVPAQCFDYGCPGLRGQLPEEMLTDPVGSQTKACAYWWAPAVLPDQLTWYHIEGAREDDLGIVVAHRRLVPDVRSRRISLLDAMVAADRLFTSTEEEFNHLFLPEGERFGFSGLPGTATAAEVADHISTWVAAHGGDGT